MKYKIVFSEDRDQLEDKVNMAISEGWKPIGGVSVSQSECHWVDCTGYSQNNFCMTFAQAMTLEP